MPIEANWDNALLTEVPVQLVNALRFYYHERTPCGHFMTAVLENNLNDALSRADTQSLRCLPELVKFIYNELDSRCWGNKEKVKKWLKREEDT